jgi:hypothetical protein
MVLALQRQNDAKALLEQWKVKAAAIEKVHHTRTLWMYCFMYDLWPVSLG